MGRYSLKAIHDVLQTTTFYTDRVRYVFLKLEKSSYPRLLQNLAQHGDVFSEVIHDKDELSVIMPNDLWEAEFAAGFEVLASIGDVALITCQVQQETVTGYLLALVTILSPHNISVFVQGAFTTDHIFVMYDQLDEALALLNQVKG